MKQDYSYDKIGEQLIEDAKNAMRENNTYGSNDNNIVYAGRSNKYSLRDLSDNRIQDLLKLIDRI